MMNERAQPRPSFFILHPSAFILLFCLGCEPTTKMAGGPVAIREVPVNGAAKPVSVELALNWYPEAEHGGFYAALVHGYYAEEGLTVDILPGGKDVSATVVPQVARGAIAFGVSNADNLLFGRAQGAPVVAVMAPLQTSPRCLIVHEKSGIRGFEDLKDMTIAMSNGAAFSAYLQKKVPLTGVTVVPYPGNVAQFLLDENYAQQAYVFSEPYVARQKGGDPRVLMLSDLGFNPYTSVLFTSDAKVRESPDVVKKMVSASIRGWRQYLDSPEETNRYIHGLNPEMELDALAYGATAIRPLVLDESAESDQIGRMTLDRWRTLAEQLVESDQLEPGEVDASKLFTTEFMSTVDP